MTATRESMLSDLSGLFKIVNGNNIDIIKLMLEMDNIDKYMKQKHKVGLSLSSDKAILNSLDSLSGLTNILKLPLIFHTGILARLTASFKYEVSIGV